MDDFPRIEWAFKNNNKTTVQWLKFCRKRYPGRGALSQVKECHGNLDAKAAGAQVGHVPEPRPSPGGSPEPGTRLLWAGALCFSPASKLAALHAVSVTCIDLWLCTDKRLICAHAKCYWYPSPPVGPSFPDWVRLEASPGIEQLRCTSTGCFSKAKSSALYITPPQPWGKGCACTRSCSTQHPCGPAHLCPGSLTRGQVCVIAPVLRPMECPGLCRDVCGRAISWTQTLEEGKSLNHKVLPSLPPYNKQII